ncbi:MAG: tRNA-dihydrouridine synthase [Parcubacteria group bacterium LiPW_41]|nr:MAG: tRNA-dihydrouridine synthase [Parcubacteria group bacterium LiPW_41]
MPKGFWKTIKKPLVAIAPMANVTDVAFRAILTKYGKPDVMWTEFVSADGLCSSKGREKLLGDLAFSKKERPIVAQIFSSKPEKIYEATKLVASLGFDGIDINMGCPDRAVVKQGAGAALIKNPKIAQEIIFAAQKGAGKIPVSVKTRIGYSKDEIETWIPMLAQSNLDAITIHGRTMKEMSKVPAHWDLIAESANIIRSFHNKKTCPIILGNGDVQNRKEAEEKCKQYGVDGVMIGRGIFTNIYAFRKKEKVLTIENRIKILLDHIKEFEKIHKNDEDAKTRKFDYLKKFFKIYISDFDGAKELRIQLMNSHSTEEVRAVVEAFKSRTF